MSSPASPGDDFTWTALAQLAEEVSGTRLTPQLNAASEAQSVADVIANTPTLVPPPGEKTHDDLLRELAARGARTSWLPARASNLAEARGIEGLEQDFLSRDPVYSLPSLTPRVTVAPPPALEPLNKPFAQRVFKIVTLAIVVLLAIEAWSLLHR